MRFGRARKGKEWEIPPADGEKEAESVPPAHGGNKSPSGGGEVLKPSPVGEGAEERGG